MRVGSWQSFQQLYLILFFLLVAGSACDGGTAPTAVSPQPILAADALPAPPTPPVTSIPPTPQITAVLPTPTSSPAPDGWQVAAETAVPSDLIAHTQELTAADPRFRWQSDPAQADVVVARNGAQPLARWVYAVAAPFPTVADTITLAGVEAAWRGEGAHKMVVDAETADFLTTRWGEPASSIIVVTDPQQMIDDLWAQRPSLTVLPFHHLRPELKVLRLDGASPLDRDFQAAGYPLVADVGLSGDAEAVAAFLARWDRPVSNRDPAKMTRVAMTGVTALVRATATQMEVQGVLYPGTAVAPVLQAADIAHVSNEVSFSPTCPYPNPVGGTSFCSRDKYFALLEELGVDVVELTGNHLNDYGRENLLHSLDLYAQAGMATFGGGRDAAHAAEAAVFSHNGNRIAFVGCNPVGPGYAWATVTQAGARPCTEEFRAQISRLADEGHVVIATQQYSEFYHYAPTSQQQADFRALAAAGAGAVSGSQGHHAQGFDFHQSSFIHYGLGNLFFDQMDRLGTRQTFVDTYVIYDNRLLNVELWTGLIENYARPREMTEAERTQMLTAVFQASGW